MTPKKWHTFKNNIKMFCSKKINFEMVPSKLVFLVWNRPFRDNLFWKVTWLFWWTVWLGWCSSGWESFCPVSNEKWHSSHSISHVQWDSLDFFILILGQAGLWSSHAPRPSFKRIPAAHQVSVEQFQGLFDIKSKGPRNPHPRALISYKSHFPYCQHLIQVFTPYSRISKVSR